MTTTGLSTSNLVIGYSDSQPLHEPINFTVTPGETLAILGPSGCGKSTLLATIAGITSALSGDILLNGVRVNELPIHKRNIGLVFQDPLLFPHLSLIDNIAYGLRAHNVDRETARVRATELLEWVGLTHVRNNRTWELSGGQAGRVALARAVAPKPEVLLFDEPFSALDSTTRIRLATEVSGLVRSQGIPAIHVTHDEQEAELVATQMMRMQK